VSVTHLVAGPREHGVTRFGIELVEALRDNGFHALAAERSAQAGVHLQFTDRLFGSSPADAAAAIRDIVDATHRHGRRVTATLHDLPQPSDGTGFDRRRTAYREVAALLDGVVVSSEHERALLAEHDVRARRVAVIPLPFDHPPFDHMPFDDAGADPQPAAPAIVGIFGFLYPGKGHAEVIAALAGRAPGVEVLALGAPSAGHDDLVEHLARHSAAAGTCFRVTGHLDDAAVPGALRGVTVPVAPHRHVSASGSLNSWIGAGRRPLAPDNRYTREILARSPGTLLLYPDTADGLRIALRDALTDPATTWLAPGIVGAPSRAAAARQYADVLGRWHS
jgi:glycosyltransferase involved in cell wall biosynthesis